MCKFRTSSIAIRQRRFSESDRDAYIRIRIRTVRTRASTPAHVCVNQIAAITRAHVHATACCHGRTNLKSSALAIVEIIMREWFCSIL